MTLKEYRRIQRKLAILRDDGNCVICYFKYKKLTKGTEVHHVFGRSQDITDKEHYTSLMSVCPSCHPPPLLSGGSPTTSWQLRYLEACNCNPINSWFEHPTKP